MYNTTSTTTTGDSSFWYYPNITTDTTTYISHPSEIFIVPDPRIVVEEKIRKLDKGEKILQKRMLRPLKK
jgi:hypothetical protein